MSQDYVMSCYCCFEKPGTVRISFLYKPWKANWRDEGVCEDCVKKMKETAGTFSEAFAKTQYGYPGLYTMIKSRNGEGPAYVPTKFNSDGTPAWTIPSTPQGYYQWDATDPNEEYFDFC